MCGIFGRFAWRAGTLLLARDRFGEKPLHYWEGAGELVFASELAPLAEHLRATRPSFERIQIKVEVSA